MRLRQARSEGTEAQLGQICRQDDDSESVAEAPRRARGALQVDVRSSYRSDPSIEPVGLVFSQSAGVTV